MVVVFAVRAFGCIVCSSSSSRLVCGRVVSWLFVVGSGRFLVGGSWVLLVGVGSCLGGWFLLCVFFGGGCFCLIVLVGCCLL